MTTNSPLPAMSPSGGDLIKTVRDTLDKLDLWRVEIEEALDRAGNTHCFDDLVALVLVGKVDLFCYDKCCVIMQKVDFPQFSAYHCFLACGDMNAIMATQAEMAQRAKELGCKELTISGRVGWPKVLKKVGWKHRLSTLYTEV